MTADLSQDGRSCGQARGTAVHQRSSCERQRRCPGLLSHVSLGPVWSNSWHPGADWTLWLYFLLLLCVSSLRAAHSQGWTALEQIFQITTTSLYWRSCGWSFYLHPILDFPVRDGACVLKCSNSNNPKLTLSNTL